MKGESDSMVVWFVLKNKRTLGRGETTVMNEYARDEGDVVDAERADDHADYNAVEGDEHGVYWSPLVLFNDVLDR